MNLIQHGIVLLNSGKLVIFPTETVYGLGADALNDDACKQIYETKNRPSNNPLIVHCHNFESIETIAQTNLIVKNLADKFWPGPLSMVLPILPNSLIAKTVTAGLNSICVRIPKHKIALELIKSTRSKMIAAPSANISNYVSPTKIEHVKSEFKNIFSIDGDQCVYGLESTILDCRGLFEAKKTITILRHGHITSNQIKKFLDEFDETFEIFDLNSKFRDVSIDNQISESTLLAPGMSKKHYSTRTKLVINYHKLKDDVSTPNQRVHIDFGEPEKYNSLPQIRLNLSLNRNLREASFRLYEILRLADDLATQNNFKLITISPIPNEELGVAINEKLIRAQHFE